MYEVFKQRIYRINEYRQDGAPWYACEMIFIGMASSMKDAKAKYGGAPVLERVL